MLPAQSSLVLLLLCAAEPTEIRGRIVNHLESMLFKLTVLIMTHFNSNHGEDFLLIFYLLPVAALPSLVLQQETDFLKSVGGERVLCHDAEGAAWTHNG